MTETKNLIVNIHIPKTAGSNFRRQMSATLGNNPYGPGIVGVDKGKGDAEAYFDSLREKAKPLVRALDGRYLKMLTGHYRYRDIAPIIAPLKDRAILVTCLRDPARRMVSDYLFGLVGGSGPTEDFVARYPDFKSYLAAPREQCKQLAYLAPHAEATAQETLDHVRATFGHVLITERFDADLGTFVARLGLTAHPATRVNDGKNGASADVLLQAHATELAEVLAPEILLYEGLKAINWPTEPFALAHRPRGPILPVWERQTTPVEDTKLRAQIRTMRPWHHNIALSPSVRTVENLDEDPENQGVSVTRPDEILFSQFLTHLPDALTRKSFLDCGCNAGGYCFAAKDAGAARTFGFDVRTHWIDQARFVANNRLQDTRDMRFEVADLLDLRSMDEMFDVTWFSGLYYHLPDAVNGLRIAADKTRDLICVNTAVAPVDAGASGERALKLKFEGVEQKMSGVHALSWLPGGPEVMRQQLKWLGFPATRLTFWTRKMARRAHVPQYGRLAMIAARDPDLLRHVPEATPIDFEQA